jgi:hypothetical protein
MMAYMNKNSAWIRANMIDGCYAVSRTDRGTSSENGRIGETGPFDGQMGVKVGLGKVSGGRKRAIRDL